MTSPTSPQQPPLIYDDPRQRKRAEREAYKQAIREREGREPCLGELLYTPDLDQQFQSAAKLLHALIDSRQPASVAVQQDVLDLMVTLRDRLSTLVCLDIERANQRRDASHEHDPPHALESAAADPPAGERIDVQIQQRAIDVLQELSRLASTRTRRIDPLAHAVEEAERLLPRGAL